MVTDFISLQKYEHPTRVADVGRTFRQLWRRPRDLRATGASFDERDALALQAGRS